MFSDAAGLPYRRGDEKPAGSRSDTGRLLYSHLQWRFSYCSSTQETRNRATSASITKYSGCCSPCRGRIANRTFVEAVLLQRGQSEPLTHSGQRRATTGELCRLSHEEFTQLFAVIRILLTKSAEKRRHGAEMKITLELAPLAIC